MKGEDADKLIKLIHGPNSSATMHLERPRRQQCSLLVSESGGDMKEVGCGEDWEHAFADMWTKEKAEGK